jgi:hypothetical protein
MKQKFKFYKEPDNRWYIDLPGFEGDQAELEMVAGADTMLDIISEGMDSVKLLLSTEYFVNSDTLEFIRLAYEYGNGAFYLLKEMRGIEFNMEIWLCSVTTYVFGDYPPEIYFSKI